MTTTNLAQQLSQLSDSLKATNALITRLSKLSFQPGSEPLDSENTVRLELAQDIHDSLKQLEEDLELLKQEAEDLSSDTAGASNKRRDSDREREKARLSAQVVRLGEDLRHSRGRFRQAQLIAKRASEVAKQKERELLFQSLHSAPDPTADGEEGAERDLFAGRRARPQQKQLSKDEQLVGASSDVTAALRRTHNLLSTELSRSRFAQETFDQSTAALSDLGERYTDLDTILSTSRNLLGTLLRSQKSDTWYLETAFYLLCATLCWLIFRRLLYGPLYLLPRFFYNVTTTLISWLVLKPLWYLAVLTGVITTQPAANARANSAITQSVSRAPLIVQPSASGGIPTFAMSDREAMQKRGGVPVGAGGAGAKVGKDGGNPLSEEIGERHEESEKQRRGDGTVLRERGADEPRNPKKKGFEADVEDAKQREKDEL